MLQFFRSFFQSRVGIAATLVFLGLIALAFASADVAGSGTFGGVAGGSRVASVGDETIGSGDLAEQVEARVNQARQNQPGATMQGFLAAGGLDRTLDTMVDRLAMAVFGRETGLRSGTNLVNSELSTLPVFQGADGSFNAETYRAALAGLGISDALVREDLAQGLFARQVLAPVALGTRMPATVARRYAALLGERRTGAIVTLPSAAFAPAAGPNAAQLQAFYRAHANAYLTPERRVIRFANFNLANAPAIARPTDAEIAARYQRDRGQYAANEERLITQLIVPTQQAAAAIIRRIRGGDRIQDAAADAGLVTDQIGPLAKPDLARQTSQAVADAAFAGTQGGMTEPARSGLGWHVMQIDRVDATPARSLADVRGVIRATIEEERRTEALNTLSSRIEDEIDGGASFADIVRTYSLAADTSPPLTADGQVYGKAGQMGPVALRPVLQPAFAAEENEPQVAELERGRSFMLFDVARVAPSAPAPLAEIRDTVAAAWKDAQGSAAAKAAAGRVIARMRGGATLAAAVAAEQKRLPIDQIRLSRPELIARGRDVPPPLALLFSMAEGTAKQLEAPADRGWFVVAVDEIEQSAIAADAPEVTQTQRGLAELVGKEYEQAMLAAIRKDVGVERNADAIAAARRQIAGPAPR